MRSQVIEGYALLFGVEAMAGDVVRAAAFSRRLSRGSSVGKLLSDFGGRTALRMVGTGRGIACRSASCRGFGRRGWSAGAR
jgi:hypothetical protein